MRNTIIFSLLIFGFLSFSLGHDDYETKEDITIEVNRRTVFYGSTVRIQNQQNGYHLHSHDLKYGTGSNQQSVTGMIADNDYNSLWTIKSGQDLPLKLYSDPVKCNDVIRLEHVLTQKNLHSHDFRSPVSQKFEVSAFGDGGNGDTADNWQLVCEKESEGTTLKPTMTFYLLHVETKRYLFTDTRHDFNHRNCGHQCPIMGQLEIAADSYKGSNARWKITSGLFYDVDLESDYSSNSGSDRSYDRDDDL